MIHTGWSVIIRQMSISDFMVPHPLIDDPTIYKPLSVNIYVNIINSFTV